MKIQIIGGSGTGKSYLAEKLSSQYHIPHYDLDDLLWDNNVKTYGTKRKLEERQAMLQQILSNDNWIIEGVYYKWCGKCFSDADKIYLLEVPQKVCRFRIIRRFIKRKLGLEKGKKETLKSLSDLLKWTKNYQMIDMIEINKLLEPYESKVIRISYVDRI